jgi:hypothetical protein
MADRKRPHLDEDTAYLNATLYTRQKTWVQWFAKRRKVYPSAVVRDALDVYRAIILAFRRRPVPPVADLIILVRAAMDSYLAQQYATEPASPEVPNE